GLFRALPRGIDVAMVLEAGCENRCAAGAGIRGCNGPAPQAHAGAQLWTQLRAHLRRLIMSVRSVLAVFARVGHVDVGARIASSDRGTTRHNACALQRAGVLLLTWLMSAMGRSVVVVSLVVVACSQSSDGSELPSVDAADASSRDQQGGNGGDAPRGGGTDTPPRPAAA